MSDIEALVDRACRNEWVDLEFKKSIAEKDQAMQTLCAFLNGRGGTVIFGVTPDSHRIIGQELSDQGLRNVAALLRHFEPIANVEQIRAPLGDGMRKELLVMRVVPVEEHQPYVFRGTPYWRVGSTTEVMPQTTYQELLRRRDHARARWENQPAADVGINDLDLEQVRRTARLAVDKGRIPEEGLTVLPEEALVRLDLMRGGQALNAAVALFGKPSPADYPQCRLMLAHFAGDSKDVPMLDHRPALHGGLFSLLEAAEQFLVRNLPVAGRTIPGVFERKDEPLFPVAALREALINAFAHRDYSIAGGSVHVAIYSDRLEITNPGALPPGLTLDDLKGSHSSIPRNPLIADILYKRGLVETWGRGTSLIVRLCREAGHPEPVFFSLPGTFGVRLRSSRPINRAGAVSIELSVRRREILEVLGARELSASEVRAALIRPPAPRTVRADLAALKKAGLVESRGWGAGAVWLRRRPPGVAQRAEGISAKAE